MRLLRVIEPVNEGELWVLVYLGSYEELQALWAWICETGTITAGRTGKHNMVLGVGDVTVMYSEEFTFTRKQDAAMCRLAHP